MKTKHYNGGYSLVELVIYIGLFIGISFVVIQSLMMVMKTYASAQRYRTMQHNGELIMERLTREIREASSISTEGSIFGTSPGVLALSGREADGTPYTVAFSVSNAIMQITENGVVSNLSSNEVSVQNLTFWNITTTTSDAIKVQLTLQTTKKPVLNTIFYSTAILRQ